MKKFFEKALFEEVDEKEVSNSQNHAKLRAVISSLQNPKTKPNDKLSFLDELHDLVDETPEIGSGPVLVDLLTNLYTDEDADLDLVKPAIEMLTKMVTVRVCMVG